MDMLEIEGTTGELRMVYSILGEDERTGTNNYLKEKATEKPTAFFRVSSAGRSEIDT